MINNERDKYVLFVTGRILYFQLLVTPDPLASGPGTPSSPRLAGEHPALSTHPAGPGR